MIDPEPLTQAVPIPPVVIRAETAGLLSRLRPKRHKRLRTGEITFLWVSRLIVTVFMILILIPALWVLSTSFNPGNLFLSTSPFPSGFTLDHYRDIFNPQIGFLTWVRNSVAVCTAVGVFTIVLVATMAYAFSRFKFRGRKYGLMFLLLVQMFPAQMSFIAFYWLLNQLTFDLPFNIFSLHHVSLYDTLIGYTFVLIGGGLPFNAWLFKGYIDSLPRDLEEAAYVDGASKLQAYLRIILPLTRPMMAVIFLFTWFGMYSEYLLASFLLSSPGNKTVALGLQSFIYTQFLQNWTDFAAFAVVGSLPLMVVFLLAQRFLVAGLARGAVKG